MKLVLANIPTNEKTIVIINTHPYRSTEIAKLIVSRCILGKYELKLFGQ